MGEGRKSAVPAGTGRRNSTSFLSRPPGACTQSSATRDTDLGVTSSPRVVSSSRNIRKGGGHYKVGKPYKVAGCRYVPRKDPNYDRRGVASWYGAAFHGRRTAKGET